MVTGFNTDVQHEGKLYHVQTEDKGTDNPVIESLIYRGGEILAARRSSYADLVTGAVEEKVIAARIEDQHNQMIEDIKAGRYDGRPQVPFGAGIISDKSFDEVVLQYLQSLAGADPIVLALVAPNRLVEGDSPVVDMLVSRKNGGKSVAGAQVKIMLLSRGGPARALAQGKTGKDGRLRLHCTLPRKADGSAVLVIEAMSGKDAAELKQPVEKMHRRAAG